VPAALLALAAGAVLLAVAADQFVVGAARLAAALRVPVLVIGVVLVGFGTSLPEALVSGSAAARGEMAVALGNVVGSNVANLSLLLGIGAMIFPITVASTVVTREWPLTLGSAVLLAVVAGGSLSRPEGFLLLGAMAAALAWVVATGRRGGPVDPLAGDVGQFIGRAPRPLVESIRTLLGLAGTLAGSQALLWGALRVADELSLASGFVGATLVAIGTSLPELVTVVQSARHRESDLIVGNLLGSNLFNALAVTGTAAVIGDAPVADRSLTVDATLAGIGLTVLAGAFLITGRRVTRGEAAVLLTAYAGFVIWLG
jgi:cation:H+ antiporter